MSTTRDDAVRAMLVDQVTATRRRRWRLPVLGVGAFVVAGALTGGAIAGTASLQQPSDQHEVAAIVSGEGTGDNDLVGNPVQRFVDGPTALVLPPRPSGATGFVVGGQCSPRMTLAVRAGSRDAPSVRCGQPAVLVPAPRDGSRTLSIVPDRAGSLTVWAGWAKRHVTPGPSAQQQAEIEDGIATRSEYLASFNRYLGCMRASGHPLGGISTSATVLLWGIPDGALRASDDCQSAETIDTSALWESEHPGDGARPYDPAADDPRYAR